MTDSGSASSDDPVVATELEVDVDVNDDVDSDFADDRAVSQAPPGSLVLIATPIGNLGDLSPRAVRELAAADAVACEDTRRTGRLLQHAGIRARRLLVVNDHTEAAMVRQVLDRLALGERVAVVTDAGTPGIADPGERLVRAVVAEGRPVVVVPGPSAVIAALVASGLSTARFVFEGFLPRKGAARTERLRELARERRTIVCYEAPHRLQRTMSDLRDALGPQRQVAIARELTKRFEEIWRGDLDAAVVWAGTEPIGEFVLVLDGAPAPDPADDEAILEALVRARAGGASTRDAVAEVVARLGASKRHVYELATAVPGAF
jgi:16S rRNA (cytidine1402-2'-O)-methyltransferase